MPKETKGKATHCGVPLFGDKLMWSKEGNVFVCMCSRSLAIEVKDVDFLKRLGKPKRQQHTCWSKRGMAFLDDIAK